MRILKNALRYVLENRWKHNRARPDYFCRAGFLCVTFTPPPSQQEDAK